jgi:probable rRNA maturation factor
MQIQYAVSGATVPQARDLRRWAKAALLDDAEVALRVVGRREGRVLNREFRGRDYATNVLTFVYDEGRPQQGDIVLCAPVVQAEAGRERRDLESHYAHLVVHGMLHLQGFDHLRAREAELMESLETEIVTRLGYADPYARSAL